MIVYLHAQGMEDAGITFGRHRNRAADVRHVRLPRIVGLDSAVLDGITGALPAGHGSLELLIINCHGVNQPERGRDHVGLQLSTGPATETGLFGADAMRVFDGLAPWWAAGNQGIEVHGCQIARGVEGRQVCHALANHAGAVVYAGLDVQIGEVLNPGDPIHAPRRWAERAFGYTGTFLAPDAWGYFEGPVLRFEPGSSHVRSGAVELAARGAWRAGTPVISHPADVDRYELEHPAEEPDV
jgi:hypothetical protein